MGGRIETRGTSAVCAVWPDSVCVCVCGRVGGGGGKGLGQCCAGRYGMVQC